MSSDEWRQLVCVRARARVQVQCRIMNCVAFYAWLALLACVACLPARKQARLLRATVRVSLSYQRARAAHRKCQLDSCARART